MAIISRLSRIFSRHPVGRGTGLLSALAVHFAAPDEATDIVRDLLHRHAPEHGAANLVTPFSRAEYDVIRAAIVAGADFQAPLGAGPNVHAVSESTPLFEVVLAPAWGKATGQVERLGGGFDNVIDRLAEDLRPDVWQPFVNHLFAAIHVHPEFEEERNTRFSFVRQLVELGADPIMALLPSVENPSLDGEGNTRDRHRFEHLMGARSDDGIPPVLHLDRRSIDDLARIQTLVVLRQTAGKIDATQGQSIRDAISLRVRDLMGQSLPAGAATPVRPRL